MAWKKASKTQRRVIELRGTKKAQFEIIEKVTKNLIEERKQIIKNFFSEINKFYGEEKFRIIGEDELSVTVEFDCTEAKVTDNGIITNNNIIVDNIVDDFTNINKVFISVPKPFNSERTFIDYVSADIRFKVHNGKGVCVVSFVATKFKLSEVALKELEKKLSRSLPT